MTNNHRLLNENLVSTLLLMKNIGKLVAEEKKYKGLQQTDHYLCTQHYQLKL